MSICLNILWNYENKVDKLWKLGKSVENSRDKYDVYAITFLSF